MTDYFRFKHFIIWQNECAMKVGTDGVLLSAWACSLLGDNHREILDKSATSLLDIGTGTGFIAMQIAAEHSNINAVAIDIDERSIRQARQNVEIANLNDRVDVRVLDFSHTEYIKDVLDGRFDIIISNPPFYEEETHNRNNREDSAKHTTRLSFEQLIAGIDASLSINGVAYLILPYSAIFKLIAICAERCLYLTHRCDVFTTTRAMQHQPQRVLLAFQRTIRPTKTSQLVLNNADGTATPAFKQLTQNVYEWH